MACSIPSSCLVLALTLIGPGLHDAAPRPTLSLVVTTTPEPKAPPAPVTVQAARKAPMRLAESAPR